MGGGGDGDHCDEWVDKAEEERLGIIAKYDKGREEGAEIEPWDDPAFEIYHVTDHYGFIHDQRFPLKFNPEENKQREQEAERADKWIKMNQSWEKYKNSEKLRKRTFKGIPNKVRGLFWGHFLDLNIIKEQQKGKYEEMYQLARMHSLDVRQIDLDVNRTYRDNIMFRERYGVKQRSLFNILCAYSIYNSEVGYCQGMSQVAALLLTYMDEEDAFWGLSQLMTHQRYGMHGFFIAGFPKLVRFQAHHDKVLKAMLPKLKKHFDKHGIDVGLYTLKWFFQCFLDRVPFELALRLWDIFLMDGDKVLICGAYTILKIHQKQLLAKKSMDDLLDYLQSRIPNDLTIENDKAIQTYQKCLEDLHRKKLDVGGEPSEDELPKRPFGLIENIVKPIPVRKEPAKEKVKPIATAQREESGEIENKFDAGATGDFEDDVGDENDEDDASEKASVSRVTGNSAASSSVANSPRNFSRPLSSVSNFSYASAIEDYNSSNKSTPLKMNGVNAVKAKTMGHIGQEDHKGQTSVSVEMKPEPEQDSPLENGSVESVNTVEFVHNQVVVNVSDNLKAKFLEEGAGSLKYIKESSRYSPEKGPRSSKQAPPPPIRSSESRNVAIVSTSTFPSGAEHVVRVESSRNGVEDPNRNSSLKRTTILEGYRVSSLSDGSRSQWTPSSINIPGGEAVRIHVPYSNSSSHSQPSHDMSTSPVKSVSGTPSSNFDTLKNDPNRIKIDISSK